MNIESTITFISLLTIIGQAVFLLTIIALLFPVRKKILAKLRLWSAPLVLFISLFSTAGSLFLSQIAKFEPCELCWFQRIFMYPLVIIAVVAWRKKHNSFFVYANGLILIGWLVSLYHNYIYYRGVTQASCSLDSHASCIIPYFTRFDFISIPVMALSAFSMLLFLAIINLKQKQD